MWEEQLITIRLKLINKGCLKWSYDRNSRTGYSVVFIPKNSKPFISIEFFLLNIVERIINIYFSPLMRKNLI